ncbi:MAG TPA: SCO family protein [Candidatus Methylomirabilis sp.]|nr:SCO family protein [Candidatus Methylomirabilis sp.]
MRRVSASFAVMCLLASVVGLPPSGFAHSPEQHKTPEAPGEVEVKPTTVRLHDLDLLDQDGKRMKFKTDVVKDRLVVIDTIYTTCPVVCPILSATFANVQQALGDRLGKGVFLISITVDPATDVPPRLKAYAERWEAKPGWIFLTGQKSTVDLVLQGLGVYSADYTDHPPTILVGDVRRGEWTRFYGFATPEQILTKVKELQNGR